MASFREDRRSSRTDMRYESDRRGGYEGRRGYDDRRGADFGRSDPHMLHSHTADERRRENALDRQQQQQLLIRRSAESGIADGYRDGYVDSSPAFTPSRRAPPESESRRIVQSDDRRLDFRLGSNASPAFLEGRRRDPRTQPRRDDDREDRRYGDDLAPLRSMESSLPKEDDRYGTFRENDSSSVNVKVPMRFELLPKKKRDDYSHVTLASFDVPKVRKSQDLFGVTPLPVETPREGPTPEHLRQNQNNRLALKWITEGQGEGVLFDGSSYAGQWRNSLPDGFGTSKHPDGTEYVGEWVGGKKEGNGTMKVKGMVYEGFMHANYFHTKGKCAFANGDAYVGEYYMNKFEGQGTYTYANKETYTGSFHFDQFHGKGKYEWPDGRSFEGTYCRDVKTGRGILISTNGRTYDGEFLDGKKHGKGKEVTQEWTYDGRYEYGQKSGHGTQKWQDGRRYDGYWKDGKKSGSGKMTTPTYTYVGEYKFGKMHGRGKLTTGNRVEEGLFEADVYMGPAPEPLEANKDEPQKGGNSSRAAPQGR
eukprot:GEMP01004536.1.p1 GENE.GEMP01004536.1~~GEMP01004536.1.p1  ORF type:complete len:535 (+),score=117.11 GEMP01004536.1:138-1742(+)